MLNLANRKAHGLTFVLATIVIMFVSGCASSPYTAPPPPAAITVSLDITNTSVPTSGTATFKVTVSNTSNSAVIWQVNGVTGGNSTVGTIVDGKYTAPATVPTPAVVNILAVSQADQSKSASAQVTITAAPSISVSVSPTSFSIVATQQKTFTATVSNDAQNLGVQWTLSGTGCSGAACGTLSASTSASGTAITYTAPASVPSPANVSLKATSVADTTKSASSALTITAPPAITVVVAPSSANVQAPSGTKTFSATVTNDTQNKGVTWTLSGTGCSGTACGTLSSSTSASGVAITYTAPSTVPSPALVTLTATSVTDGTKTSSAAITVIPPPAITVTVAPTSASVQSPSGTQPFTATVTSDAQNQGVTWTLSGTGCSGATCGTLSSASSASGTAITYTAPAAVPSPATVMLTATSVTDATRSASATITVTPVVVGNISVAITPKRGGLTISQNLGVSAVVTNDVGAAGVSWSASGTSCSGNACGSFLGATTTSATFVAPSTAGVYTITATSVADGSKSASATIGVTDLAGVYTYHNDLARDGANTQEYALTTANVNATTFGKLFSCPVDGAVIAQPLWVANLTINSAKHNVVFVATTHDSVYAFDADTKPCQQLWTKNLLPAGETFLSNNDVGTGDIQPDIGIIGTPVIDPASNLIYAVTKSKDGDGTVEGAV